MLFSVVPHSIYIVISLIETITKFSKSIREGGYSVKSLHTYAANLLTYKRFLMSLFCAESFYCALYQSSFLLINKIERSVLVLILKGLHGIGESGEWSDQFHC
tara:strand:- start:255 stop:563 length:309 start_codon:yes stop_codon:yes gene_type:complete